MKRSSRRFFSKYLTMRDGVKIAIDVWLPKAAVNPDKESVPTILRQTRYFRSIRLRFPLSLLTLGKPIDHSGLYKKRRNLFLKSGYAWVDVDVRGSGASFGHRDSPWGKEEVADGAEIVDWIIDQPWSNGSVGSLGISYDGTASEMLLVNRHPAVKAIAPRFACYDAFSDIGFPNGVFNRWFNEAWGHLNRSLDANRLQDLAGWYIPLVTSGVSAVDEDVDGSLRARAIADHIENYDVVARARKISFCDDDPLRGETSDEPPCICDRHNDQPQTGTRAFSPSTHRVLINESGAAIYNVAGWWDGTYARAAAQRFHAVGTEGSRLLLGPWNHGGGWHIDPANRTTKNRFDHDRDLLNFFDHHLKTNSDEQQTLRKVSNINRDTNCEPPPLATGQPHENAEPAASAVGSGHSSRVERQEILNGQIAPVRYYTMVESKWKTANQWPPENSKFVDYYLDQALGLTQEPPSVNSVSEYQVVPVGSISSGKQTSRWRTQAGVDERVGYRDRQKICQRLLSFKTSALRENTEVTGHPVIDFFVATNSADTLLFLYLEDVHPDGTTLLVTEGLLDTRHRKIVDDETNRDDSLLALGVPQHSYRRDDDLPMVVSTDPANASNEATGSANNEATVNANNESTGCANNVSTGCAIARLQFDLLPTSYLFRAGHAIQISISGTDTDHFRVPAVLPKLAVFHGGRNLSRVQLPCCS